MAHDGIEWLIPFVMNFEGPYGRVILPNCAPRLFHTHIFLPHVHTSLSQNGSLSGILEAKPGHHRLKTGIPRDLASFLKNFLFLPLVDPH